MIGKKLKKTEPSSIPAPSIENLKVSSVDGKFDLKKRGVKDGGNNTPSSDSVNFSPTELEVQGHFNAEMASAKSKYLEVEKSYREERNTLRNTLNPEFDIESLKKIGKIAENAIDNIYTMRALAIDKCNSTYKETEKNYKGFQVNNELTNRTPLYPENLLLFLRLVIALSVIELFISFAFFQTGTTPQISMALALLTVFINIMMAGFAGHRMRYINHVKTRERWIHGLLGVFFFMLFIGLIFYLAHLRAAIPEIIKIATASKEILNTLTEAGKMAGANFLNNPFSILGNAFPTVFVGGALMFGVFTFLKGYKIEDEYPGYSELHKQLEKAKTKLIRLNQKLIDDIDKELNTMDARLINEKEKIQVRTMSFLSNIEDQEVLHKKIKGEQGGINKNFEACIGIYRQANVYTRDKDKPAPPYFENTPMLENDLLQSMTPVSEEDKKFAETLKGHLSKVTKSFSETASALQAFRSETTKKINLQVETTA